jgi:hypothetical protein
MPKDPRLERAGVEGFNKPKRTPNHPTKSHVVVAKEGDQVKTIRFGQQGVSGSPKKKGESESYRKRRESFKARHAKNIAKGKMSAAWWSSHTKWIIITASTIGMELANYADYFGFASFV